KAPFVVGAAVGAVAAWAVLADRVGNLQPQPASPLTLDERADTRVPGPASSAAQVFAGLADDEALAALAQVEQPAEVRSAALALLDVFGRDEQGISRVADALDEAERRNFTFHAIATVAANDPARAIELALALDDVPGRSEALRRVATVLSNLD